MKPILLTVALFLPLQSLAHEEIKHINKLAKCTVSADILNKSSYHEYRRRTKSAIKAHYGSGNVQYILRNELREAERKIEKKARRQHTNRRDIARDILHSPKCHVHRDYHYEYGRDDYRHDDYGRVDFYESQGALKIEGELSIGTQDIQPMTTEPSKPQSP